MFPGVIELAGGRVSTSVVFIEEGERLRRAIEGRKSGWSLRRLDSVKEAVDVECDAVVIDAAGSEIDARDTLRLLSADDRGRALVFVLPDDAASDAVAIAEAGGTWLFDTLMSTPTGPRLLGELLERALREQRIQAEYQRQKQTQDQLIQAEKLAAVGLLAAEIAHEINNPSTFVITNLSVLIDYVATINEFHADVREVLDREGYITQVQYARLEERHEIEFLQEDMDSLVERSLAGLERIHQIVEDLRYFSHDKPARPGWVNVQRLLKASVNLVKHEAKYRAALDVDVETLPALFTDASRLGQVFLNLLVNAVQAVEPGAPDEHCIRVTSEKDDGIVRIAIQDDGAGIEPDVLPRIFDPFFTTKEPGTGTGLGLSISRDIMHGLGGDIEVSSTPGEGSTFTVVLPIRASDDDIDTV